MFEVQCGEVKFTSIAAILWDKDGTLADSHGFLSELAHLRSRRLDDQVPGLYTPLMAAFGCAEQCYDPAGLMAVGTRYENEIAAAAYVAATGMAWTEALTRAQRAFADSDRAVNRKADLTPPFSGIPNLLRQAHRLGLKMAVLSGDTTDNIRDFLVRYDLAEAIVWCAGSEVPPIKPDPQMVWTACDKLGVIPAQCLVIGDSGHDLKLAQQGGCAGFVSVTWGGSPAIAGAQATIAHPQALSWTIQLSD